MTVITSTRRATYNEVVREMDRRGTVIETLEEAVRIAESAGDDGWLAWKPEHVRG